MGRHTRDIHPGVATVLRGESLNKDYEQYLNYLRSELDSSEVMIIYSEKVDSLYPAIEVVVMPAKGKRRSFDALVPKNGNYARAAKELKNRINRVYGEEVV